jgi:PAS domain S-box-containing protein
MALAAIALAVLLAGLGVLAWRRRPLGALSIWAWAWGVFVVERAALGLAPEQPSCLALALLAAALFPALQVAGTRVCAGLGEWPWLLPGALALGAIGALSTPRFGAGPAHALLALWHAGLFAAAASQARRIEAEGHPGLPERALPAVFLGLAVLGGVESLAWAFGAEAAFANAIWLVAAPGAGLCQLMGVTDAQARTAAQREARRAEAERRLAASEERYRRLTELSSDFSYAVRVRADGTWRPLWLTRAFTRLTGFTPKEVEGGWFHLLVPEDRDAARERYLAVLAGAEGEHEYRIRTKSGELRWLRERMRSALDAASGDVVLYGAVHDITERKRAQEERERLQARLHESQRLESMGAMARGIAHDFNQLLTPILGQASAGLAELDARSPLHPRLERIRQAAEYAAALVQQMLTYAGQGAYAAEPVDLSRLVEEMLPLLRAAVTSSVRIETDLAPVLPVLRADPTQLRQVLVNLVSNAAQALSGGGTVWVRTRSVHADARLLDRAVLTSSCGPGCFVILEVEDDGAGMDEAAREHLFDPFFTTRPQGSGLGLSTVLGIVRRHEGAILVDSEPGEGSCFRILLPALEAGEAAVPTGASRDAPAARGGRVLLVDDDEAVAEVASAFLSRAGFEVRVATSGKEGLEIFELERDAFDAVVLDWAMPGMDGAVLLPAIRSLAPGLPVVVATGLDAPGLPEKPGTGALRLVRKPFAPETLVGALHEALREAAGSGPAPPAPGVSQ